MINKEFAERFSAIFKNLSETEFMEKAPSVLGKMSKWRLKRCYKDYKKGYLWLGFNYGLVPCFEGNEARREYDKADKTDAFQVLSECAFLRPGEFCCERLERELLTAEGVDNSCLAEFYIIGKDFSWCYVVTHEFDGAGPYFCYAPKGV